jgi:hypothetical protein
VWGGAGQRWGGEAPRRDDLGQALVEELLALDLTRLTPLEALLKLQQLRAKLRPVALWEAAD